MAALLALLIGSLLLAVPGLRSVLDEIGEARPGWIALAVALEIASSISFVVIFRHFFDGVPKRAARKVAWTEMATGALLPGGGTGGLAIGGWLLHLQGMPVRRILRRSSGLFFLTSAVNVAVVAAAGALLATGLAGGPHDFVHAGLPILAAAGAVAAVVALPRIAERRRDADHWTRHLTDGIRDAERALGRPQWRLAGAIGWLGFDIAVLWATFEAVGHSPPVFALVLAYMLGYLANALPVPGGLGVLDGGLAAMLVIYGASATTATAAVLIYHAIALWVPGVGGSIAYAWLRRDLAKPRERGESRAPASSATWSPEPAASSSASSLGRAPRFRRPDGAIAGSSAPSFRVVATPAPGFQMAAVCPSTSVAGACSSTSFEMPAPGRRRARAGETVR